MAHFNEPGSEIWSSGCLTGEVWNDLLQTFDLFSGHIVKLGNIIPTIDGMSSKALRQFIKVTGHIQHQNIIYTVNLSIEGDGPFYDLSGQEVCILF